ncbi:MAG: peptidylprolyl isomerase [Undibacterium sp.]
MEVQLPIKPFRAQWPRVLAATIILLLLLALGLAVVVYKFPDTAFGRLFVSRLPFPVVMIGKGVAVTTSGLAENREALRHFYESQDFSQIGMRVDFTTEDGEKRLKLREKDLVNKMLEDKAIQMLAEERGITVTQDQVETATTVKMKELGTTDKVEQSLARLYNWTIADFQEKIVRPAMYEEALYSEYQKEVDQSKPKERITLAEKSLKEKKAFNDVAQTYSEGETSATGGDLGWFVLEDLAPELRSPVDNAKLNVPTGVIESDLGYHIMLVQETKVEDDGLRSYHLRQIFTRKVSFADWVAEKMRAMPISVLSSEYEWRVDEARIDFRSETLRQFERQIRENAESDPTVLF